MSSLLSEPSATWTPLPCGCNGTLPASAADGPFPTARLPAMYSAFIAWAVEGLESGTGTEDSSHALPSTPPPEWCASSDIPKFLIIAAILAAGLEGKASAVQPVCTGRIKPAAEGTSGWHIASVACMCSAECSECSSANRHLLGVPMMLHSITNSCPSTSGSTSSCPKKCCAQQAGP